MDLLISLLEAIDNKAALFTLQQELIDELPEDYEVSLTNDVPDRISVMGQAAVKVMHDSYDKNLHGYVLVFPGIPGRNNSRLRLVYRFKATDECCVIYSDAHELAVDLQKNIQTNSL
jgi:hypothetical protein